jgi:uncharacterized protein YbjQ (UPF0145 family)
MGIFDFLRSPSPEERELRATHERRLGEMATFLQNGPLPSDMTERLRGARAGTLPWTATLTAAELAIARSHGLRPIATVSATCWLHYGFSWTLGHSEGWAKALQRLKEEAYTAGANAVLDVKMRTIPLGGAESMDFTLVGTAVHVEGLEPSGDPIVATVPALEFVKLLEADVVPTGIAVGAYYDWLMDAGNTARMTWRGNIESQQLSQLWERVRTRAHQDLRANARAQGNGVLAHVNFSQNFESEVNDRKAFLARHIVVATTVDARKGDAFPHDVRIVVDLCAGKTPLAGTARHHESYELNDTEGAI